jgi:hypothetical protein
VRVCELTKPFFAVLARAMYRSNHASYPDIKLEIDSDPGSLTSRPTAATPGAPRRAGCARNDRGAERVAMRMAAVAHA